MDCLFFRSRYEADRNVNEAETEHTFPDWSHVVPLSRYRNKAAVAGSYFNVSISYVIKRVRWYY